MAHVHKVLEVGNVLVGHVVVVEYSWCSWEWLVMDGNDGSYRPMGTPYIVPVRNTLNPSSHADQPHPEYQSSDDCAIKGLLYCIRPMTDQTHTGSYQSPVIVSSPSYDLSLFN